MKTRQSEKLNPVPQLRPRPAGRRARRPSLGEDEFLKKALEVFCEKGFDGASIDAITTAAGIAKRTIYARYGNKESLFKAAVERAIDEWNVPVERLRQAESDSLEDSLFAIGQILVENILTPAGLRLLRLTNAESGRMPSIGEHNVRYGEEPVIAYLADLFRRKLPESVGGFAETRDAAEAFLHLVVGGPANAAAWGVVRNDETIARRARLSICIFVNGLITIAANGIPKSVLEKTDAELADLKQLLAEMSERVDKVRGCLKPDAVNND